MPLTKLTLHLTLAQPQPPQNPTPEPTTQPQPNPDTRSDPLLYARWRVGNNKQRATLSGCLMLRTCRVKTVKTS